MEIRCSNLLKKLPLESGTVLDIGGSYGYYALLLGRLVGEDGQVFSFDPDWHSFERLTHNLAMNNIKNVIPVPICASNSSNGLAQWHFFENKPWNSRLADDGIESDSQKLAIVPVMKLDDFAYAINILEKTRLIKIDVEGAELKVLEGATKLLEEAKPVLLCELHGSEIAQKVFVFLSEVNYQWEMIEYMSEARQHVLAFPSVQAERYRSMIFHFAG
jgi:FkbM family methyltransferase